MKPYKVITDYNMARLEYRVNEEIEDGYKPIGGISISYANGTMYYSQAVYKEEMESI